MRSPFRHAMKPLASLPVLALSLTLAAPAQSLVVPAAQASTDGASSGALAGITKRARQQVLVDASHLQAASGHAFDALWFRRDANGATALTGGTADLTITLSETSRVPAAASASFAQNHGFAPVVVFSGPLQVPASPEVILDPWAQDQTLRLPFSTPFPCGTANLCIEIVANGTGFATPRWPVDCALENLSGSTVSLGQHCSSVPELPGTESLFTNAMQLTIGATAVFSALGRVDTPAILLIGFELGSAGLDLSAAGMTGCTLWLQPAASLASVFAGQPALTPRWEMGGARFTLPVPFQPSLLGGTFATQALDLETGSAQSNPLGIALSQGLRCTLAAQAPSLGMAMVETPPVDAPAMLPTEGVVVTNRAPVLKLLYH